MSKFTIYVVLIALILQSGCVRAQKDVPESVQKAFTEKYPGENDPDWHLDANGNYESNFKIDGKKFRADFSPEGYWIETESSIDEDELPDAIKKVLQEKYEDEDITEIEEVTHHKKGHFYDIEFKKKGKNKDLKIRVDGSIMGID